ncbi:MAG: porphobilinogen synthase [Deltaproteobacteria bacterium CG11_big_fil_rev_8_21_14_0_20_45_16]|nr:MAG: porphobilinogen synthase [Deltaproteobacteria bacterium CG11_big_fil_rev_8_21_14_0_20_45_16]
MNLLERPRRLRQSESIRLLVREVTIDPSKLILPLFVCEGKGIEKKNAHLPQLFTYSTDKLMVFLKSIEDAEIGTFLLFGVSDKKDSKGSEALNSDSALCHAIAEIRGKYPKAIVATDLALDPYTDHGHDGLYKNGEILNDETVEVLCQMALLHAKYGAQILAPSDMMDGRVGAIRNALDANSYKNAAILSYTAKYASCFYGPFRDTLASKVIGDKLAYQMDPSNRREAERELELDISESADIVMVKPASHYLDIISDFRDRSLVPVAAYHVSGEAAMLELGAKNGLFDRKRAIQEVTTSIFRAGADLIATYFAVELSRWGKQ